MSYQDTIDYLYSRLPLFSRIGPAAIKADLHNTIAICDFLGNPQNKFKTIQTRAIIRWLNNTNLF